MLENFSLRRKLAFIALGPILVLVVLLVLSIRSDLGVEALGIGLLVAALFAFGAITAVAKGVTNSLRALRDETTRVAQSDLPQLADSIRTGVPLSESFYEPRELSGIGDDEFGEVAAELHSIRHSAAGIGGQVAELQSGIADTFVNLARRNQSLLDRQLEAIDTLEAEERDSDRLAVMYRVDHLATRMRRNAESLLVLADAKSPERHGPSVELRDVLRVAIGEVEDYRRIVPIALDDLSVPGHRAQDLAHLLAELMENAAQQSPPGSAVDVSGGYEPTTGDYIISILDKGTGIPADQLASLNNLLATPPSSTMTISHSIGLHVVSRLSHTIGIDVRLAQAPEDGTLAAVRVPAALATDWGGQPSVEPATPQVAPIPEMLAAPVPTPLSVDTSAPALDVPAAPDLGMPAMPDTPAAPGFDIPAAPDVSVPQVDLPGTPAFETPAMPEAPATPGFDIPAAPDVSVPQVDVPAAPDLGMPAMPETPAMPAFDPQVDVPAAPDLGMPAMPDTPAAPGFDIPAAPDVSVPQVDLPGTPAFETPAFETPVVPEAPAPIPDLGAPAFETPAFETPVVPDAPAPIPDLAAPAFETPVAPEAPAPIPDLAAPAFEAPAAPAAPAFEVPAPPAAPVAPAPIPQSFPAVTPDPVASQPPPTPAQVPSHAPQPEVAASAPPAPAAPAPAAAPAPEPADATTKSGLTRRKRSASAGEAVDLDADRAAPSQRSPDQVRNMLSRYKTGLEKGRTGSSRTDGE